MLKRMFWLAGFCDIIERSLSQCSRPWKGVEVLRFEGAL